MKKTKQILNKNKLQGFMAGMALIIAAIIIIIIVSISGVVIRHINKSSTPINSTLAYSIADSVIRCVDSINKNIGTSTGGALVSVIPITTPFNNNSMYATSSIKCLGSEIFSTDTATTTYIATSTSSNAPTKYVGGPITNVLLYYDFGYDRASFPQSCVYLQIFATTTDKWVHKRFTATGRVPCNGSNVSRTITLESNELK